MSRARVAFYGDDITGSVDVLLQFARLGWRGRLFIGTPPADVLAAAAVQSEVVGIAGIARSLPTPLLDAEVRPALHALATLRPDIVQYKACSTADSSPEIGSLGRVLEIGREIFGAQPVPLLFAQPDFGRYTAFGHHFAAEGGEVYRLDRQPTMSTHPSTPMHESHLATHLSTQTDLPIGTMPFLSYTDDAALAALIAAAPEAAVVLDAMDDDHVLLIGRAITALPRPTFVIGSGGLSRGVASTAAVPETASVPEPVEGSPAPVLAVSGSRSPQTRRQVDAAARAGWHVAVLPRNPSEASEVAISALRAGRSVVLTADDAPSGSVHDTLTRISESAARTILAAVGAGATTKVIVCGGDTSGRVMRLIGVESVSIAANPAGNIVVLRAQAPGSPMDRVQLVLKGGQMGDIDLFESIRGIV